VTEIDELLLVSKLKSGDESAVTHWFTTYKRGIERFISSKISLQADVEELVQEVFLTCLRELVHFRHQSSLKTWMLTIARHKVADFYRATYAKKMIHAVSLLDEMALPDFHQTQDQIQAVQVVLSALAPEARELLLAKYIDGKSVLWLAQKLAKTTKAVESMLFRARTEFKTQYAVIIRESA
jgi:RNA polymerase sigma-70 factor (ECF subfamily)